MTRGLDRELEALEEEHRRSPDDPRALLQLVRHLERAGERPRAWYLLDRFDQEYPGTAAAKYLEGFHLDLPFDPEPSPSLLPPADPLGPKPRILALAFHPAETLLAASTQKGEIWLWNLTTPEEAPRKVGQVHGGVPSLTFTTDGDALLSGARGESNVKRWVLAEDRVENMLYTSHRVTGLLHYRDQILEATGVWVDARPAVPGDQTWLPETRHFCGGRQDFLMPPRTWLDPGPRQALLETLEDYAHATAFTDPLGRAVAVLHPDGVGLHTLEGGHQLRIDHPAFQGKTWNPSGESTSSFFSLAPGGDAMATAHKGRPRKGAADHPSAHLCLLQGEPRVIEIPTPALATAVAFSPSVTRLAIGCIDGRVLVLRLLPGASRSRPDEATRVGQDLPGGSGASFVETPDCPLPAAGGFELLGRVGGVEGGRKLTSTGLSALKVLSDRVIVRRLEEKTEHEVADLATGEIAEISHREALPWPRHRRREPVRNRKAIDALLEAKTKLWEPSPDAPIHAVMATNHRKRFWILDPRDTGTVQAFDLNRNIVALAWTPRGTRLVVLADDGVLWIYGAAPD